MKAIITLLFASIALTVAKPETEIVLKPNKEGDRKYGAQLIDKFNAILVTDMEQKVKFEAFEKPAKERGAGRYLGSSATPLILQESEVVDFRDIGGKRDYTQTVVLYYSFSEGFHKGTEVKSGVFAVFNLVGHQRFSYEGDDKFKLLKHTVTAEFKGFQKTIHAQ